MDERVDGRWKENLGRNLGHRSMLRASAPIFCPRPVLSCGAEALLQQKKSLRLLVFYFSAVRSIPARGNSSFQSIISRINDPGGKERFLAFFPVQTVYGLRQNGSHQSHGKENGPQLFSERKFSYTEERFHSISQDLNTKCLLVNFHNIFQLVNLFCPAHKFRNAKFLFLSSGN